MWLERFEDQPINESRKPLLVRILALACLLIAPALCCFAAGVSTPVGSIAFVSHSPPVIWKADLPSGKLTIGDSLTAEIGLYFYEMPGHGYFDSVWQACISIVGPGTNEKFTSDLMPIAVGKRESYRIAMPLSQTGHYVLYASFAAVTAREDSPSGDDRSSLFVFRSDLAESRVRVDNSSSPCKSERLCKTFVEGGALYHRCELPPYVAEPSNATVLGNIELECNSIYVVEVAGIDIIDSLRLPDPSLGTAELLSENTTIIRTSLSQRFAVLFLFSGDRVLRLFLNRLTDPFQAQCPEYLDRGHGVQLLRPQVPPVAMYVEIVTQPKFAGDTLNAFMSFGFTDVPPCALDCSYTARLTIPEGFEFISGDTLLTGAGFWQTTGSLGVLMIAKEVGVCSIQGTLSACRFASSYLEGIDTTEAGPYLYQVQDSAQCRVWQHPTE